MFERTEYPRPQFRREKWLSLNGTWECAFDDSGEGDRLGYWTGKRELPLSINVPFSYEYPASGIGDTSPHEVVWYRRKFHAEGMDGRALLCFNGADYQTDVWVNGIHASSHTGGFTPFSVDVTELLQEGENVLVVRCKDSPNDAVPRGKQSWMGKPFACWYTPTTGIWQSVWLEFFGEDCIGEYSLLADFDRSAFHGEIVTLRKRADRLEIAASFRGELLTRQSVSLRGGRTEYCVHLPRSFTSDYAWTPEKPQLIDVTFSLYCGEERVDHAITRFGMKKIAVDTYGKICLNGRPYYQRLILDQGYWRESGLTPPSKEALREDIVLAKEMGFNGARKHQKLEDPYYYYYAEELGFLTWCELPSAYRYCSEEAAALTQEWQRMVCIARNQTSNVCYVPLNESWGVKEIVSGPSERAFARSLYYLTKALAPDAVVSTNDGFEIVGPTDVVGIHDYDAEKEEDFAKYEARLDGLHPQGFALFAPGEKYAGQPVLLTEFGGRAFSKDAADGAWGYSGNAENEEAFLKQLASLMQGVAASDFQGYCYTQLTDVQQEVNGLLTQDRRPKADIKRIRKIFLQEKE